MTTKNLIFMEKGLHLCYFLNNDLPNYRHYASFLRMIMKGVILFNNLSMIDLMINNKVHIVYYVDYDTGLKWLNFCFCFPYVKFYRHLHTIRDLSTVIYLNQFS